MKSKLKNILTAIALPLAFASIAAILAPNVSINGVQAGFFANAACWFLLLLFVDGLIGFVSDSYKAIKN